MSKVEGFNINKFLPLQTGLLDYVNKAYQPFHTPGHKGNVALLTNIDPLRFAALDLTELPGLDNLHQPHGIIAQAQGKCAEWLGVTHTFFLVNGASIGIQAAILASNKPQEEILVPRNAHKSVAAALVLSGGRPIYYQPEIHPEFALPLGQTPQVVMNALMTRPQVKQLLAVYPTYYGTTWDLAEVRNWKGTIIVDEAHGAHFPFISGPPISSIKFGADLIIHGSHKTLATFTQTAMLHVGQGSQISVESLSQALDILHTTSPSYLLLAGLESGFWDAVEKSAGFWQILTEACLELKHWLKASGVRVLDTEDIGKYGVSGVDPLKILIHVPNGQAGRVVANLRKLNIQPELWDANNILFIIGAGDTPNSLRILQNALQGELASLVMASKQEGIVTKLEIPKQELVPGEAFRSAKELIPLTDAVNRVSGETLSPYPPGVPVVVPGEIINQEIIDYILWSKSQGVHWQGTVDPDLQRILVIKETER